ncbi:hypothetical protein ABTN05_08195 [Acinetobacter baumannii]|uniref:hypothetical protein n=1 Tax=Acinetobacter baumannii TaxID=470 RepID=UPI0033191CA3
MFITSFGEQNITYKCCSNFLIHLCEKAVELHGFLSRAQLDCNYHYYSEELKEAAAKCTKHDLGEKYGREVMKFGMKEFEERKKEDAQGHFCHKVLKEFPKYIKQ